MKKKANKPLDWKVVEHDKAKEVAVVDGLVFRRSKYRGRYRGVARYFWRLELFVAQAKGKAWEMIGRYLHVEVLNKTVRKKAKEIAARSKRAKPLAKVR